MKIMSVQPYPETWTEYLTVRELREALSDPRLMEGDLTNVVAVSRSGDPRFQLKVENEADRELEEMEKETEGAP
jgi:hypothetical protein